MRDIIKYESGQQLGGCIYLHDVPSDGIRKAKFKCKCGNEFESQVGNVKSGHSKSCGCLALKIRTKHNLSHTAMYQRWTSMISRCYNSNYESYPDYGGRGIGVCKEWKNNAECWYNYVMSLPNAMKNGYSIDRIKNDMDYEPNNVRWATQHTQTINSRKRKDNSSGYTGIYFTKNKSRCYVEICVLGQRFKLGRFRDIYSAVWARNCFIIDNELFEYKIQSVKEQ